jgi:type I restriction enzyme S subunit
MKHRVISKDSVLLSFKLSIGKLGIAGRDMYCNEAITYLNSKIPKISQMYLYYILEGLNIEKYGRGTIGKNGNLNKEILKNLQIPIPKSPAKIHAWVDKISEPYNAKMEKQTQIKELETIVQERIRTMTDFDEVELENILKYETKINKYQAKDGFTEGKYKFYTSSQDKILYRDDYEFENTHLLIGRGGVASLHLSSKFSVSHDDVYVLSGKEGYDLNYIYHFMKSNMGLMHDTFKGSTIKHCSKTTLHDLKIRIPKNKQFIKSLETTFQQIEQLQQEVTHADALYQQYIRELSAEAIP